jgi:hypothetical protein
LSRSYFGTASASSDVWSTDKETDKEDEHLGGGEEEGILFLKKDDIVWFKPPNGLIK